MQVELDIAEAHPDILALAGSDEQNNKACELSHDCCNGSTSDLHVKSQDKKRVKDHIHHCTGHKSYHGIYCASLKTELVVDNELSHHKWCSDQNYPHVVHCELHCSVRSSQEMSYRSCKDIADNCKDYTDDYRHGKSRGCHFIGFLVVACSKHSREVITRAMPKKESKSLDDGHHSEHEANGCRGRSVYCRVVGYSCHKERVRRVVYCCYQHADNCGHRQ